jgi:peptidoglycan/LPS O-acetylase OafA/YrhL
MKNRIADIEILRAFAVILVVVEHMHLNLFTWNTPVLDRLFTYLGGWTGVDLFFAISGFVIARDLLPRLQSAGNRQEYFNSAIEFWIRRFWRLTPSAWVWLTLIMLATVFLNDSGVWGSFRGNFQSVISALLHVANLHLAIVFGNDFAGASFIYWSLSLEEQFYLLLPFIVLLSGRWLPQVLALIVVVQLLTVRDTLYPVLLRTDALFLGVLLAMWSKKESYRLFEPRFLNNRVAALVTFGILLGTLACIGSDSLAIIDLRFGLIALLSALLVFIASFDNDYLFRGRWIKAVFMWIGARSYALYLTHLPSYFLTREIWYRIEPPGTRFNADYTYQFLAVALVIMVVSSELNFRFVETPLRKKGMRIAQGMRERSAATAE